MCDGLSELQNEALTEPCVFSWFPEDVENTSVEDMMMALKNCKVRTGP